MRDNYISDGQNVDALCGMSEDKIAAGYSRIEKDNDIDSDVEWEMSHGAFDEIQEMQDEFSDGEDRNYFFVYIFSLLSIFL